MCFASSLGSCIILVACDFSLRMRFANGLSPCTLFLVALILKVSKCVLQLVENLAFNPCLHRASIGKCVLQIELKRSAICGLILKVCKCVLQLVENLAFIVVCIASQLCKCVLQIELKRSAICCVILKVCKYVLQLVENLM